MCLKALVDYVKRRNIKRNQHFSKPVIGKLYVDHITKCRRTQAHCLRNQPIGLSIETLEAHNADEQIEDLHKVRCPDTPRPLNEHGRGRTTSLRLHHVDNILLRNLKKHYLEDTHGMKTMTGFKCTTKTNPIEAQ